jgi:hypothetical protein
MARRRAGSGLRWAQVDQFRTPRCEWGTALVLGWKLWPARASGQAARAGRSPGLANKAARSICAQGIVHWRACHRCHPLPKSQFQAGSQSRRPLRCFGLGVPARRQASQGAAGRVGRGGQPGDAQKGHVPRKAAAVLGDRQRRSQRGWIFLARQGSLGRAAGTPAPRSAWGDGRLAVSSRSASCFARAVGLGYFGRRHFMRSSFGARPSGAVEDRTG